MKPVYDFYLFRSNRFIGLDHKYIYKWSARRLQLAPIILNSGAALVVSGGTVTICVGIICNVCEWRAFQGKSVAL